MNNILEQVLNHTDPDPINLGERAAYALACELRAGTISINEVRATIRRRAELNITRQTLSDDSPVIYIHGIPTSNLKAYEEKAQHPTRTLSRAEFTLNPSITRVGADDEPERFQTAILKGNEPLGRAYIKKISEIAETFNDPLGPDCVETFTVEIFGKHRKISVTGQGHMPKAYWPAQRPDLMPDINRIVERQIAYAKRSIKDEGYLLQPELEILGELERTSEVTLDPLQRRRTKREGLTEEAIGILRVAASIQRKKWY